MAERHPPCACTTFCGCICASVGSFPCFGLGESRRREHGCAEWGPCPRLFLCTCSRALPSGDGRDAEGIGDLEVRAPCVLDAGSASGQPAVRTELARRHRVAEGRCC